MYANDRYSLTRYSVNQEARTVEIAESFSETLGAVSGAAVPVAFQGRCAEAMQGSVRGTISLISALQASGDLLAAVKMSAEAAARAAFAGALQARASGQKNTPAALAASDVLTALPYAAKEVPVPALALADRLAARASGAKELPARLSASEVLTALPEATSQTTERTTLELTIPPGGELLIDSDLFLVLLDGENALHTQSGDWICVSRELLRLVVESAAGGGLEGQLIYTERYL